MKALLADMDPQLSAALVVVLMTLNALLVAIANILQSWWQRRKAGEDERRAEIKAAKEKAADEEKRKRQSEQINLAAREATAAATAAKASLAKNQENSAKLDNVHESLNGNGVGGQIRALSQQVAGLEDRIENRHQEAMTYNRETRTLAEQNSKRLDEMSKEQ